MLLQAFGFINLFVSYTYGVATAVTLSGSKELKVVPGLVGSLVFLAPVGTVFTGNLVWLMPNIIITTLLPNLIKY